jgi:hypothetical protein
LNNTTNLDDVHFDVYNYEDDKDAVDFIMINEDDSHDQHSQIMKAMWSHPGDKAILIAHIDENNNSANALSIEAEIYETLYVDDSAYVGKLYTMISDEDILEDIDDTLPNFGTTLLIVGAVIVALFILSAFIISAIMIAATGGAFLSIFVLMIAAVKTAVAMLATAGASYAAALPLMMLGAGTGAVLASVGGAVMLFSSIHNAIVSNSKDDSEVEDYSKDEEISSEKITEVHVGGCCV